MKKLLFTALFCIMATSGMEAQYTKINEILDRLEEKKGNHQDLSNENIDDKKFVLIKDFDDHGERQVLVVKGNQATFIEMFDDKQTGETSSNVFSGDVVRTSSNILSFRFDMLEGKKISLPIVKTMLLMKQKRFLYLSDVNSKERWIEESALGKDKKEK